MSAHSSENEKRSEDDRPSDPTAHLPPGTGEALLRVAAYVLEARGELTVLTLRRVERSTRRSEGEPPRLS